MIQIRNVLIPPRFPQSARNPQFPNTQNSVRGNELIDCCTLVRSKIGDSVPPPVAGTSAHPHTTGTDNEGGTQSPILLPTRVHGWPKLFHEDRLLPASKTNFKMHISKSKFQNAYFKLDIAKYRGGRRDTRRPRCLPPSPTPSSFR